MMHDVLHYYQPHLHHFLGLKKHALPPTLARAYYWSFEDALWDVLPTVGIAKGSTILLPDFYCMDVVRNIIGHGYNVAYYPLNASFQISESLFKTYVKKYQPSVVVIFHACGIPSTILRTPFLQTLMEKHILVIEDAVHHLVDMSAVTLQHNNHILIDSLRKVSPLPGSFVYGKPEIISQLQQHISIFSWYTVRSGFFYFIFWIGMKYASFFSFSKLAHDFHNNVLKWHDDIIGDELHSHKGLPIIPYIHQYVDVKKIHNIKQQQVALYKQTLQFLRIKHQACARTQNLHVFPFVTSPYIAQALQSLLAKKGLYITHKFADSPWSKKHAVLFLPLGPHVTHHEIVSLCHTMATCLSMISSYPNDPIAILSHPRTQQVQ